MRDRRGKKWAGRADFPDLGGLPTPWNPRNTGCLLDHRRPTHIILVRAVELDEPWQVVRKPWTRDAKRRQVAGRLGRVVAHRVVEVVELLALHPEIALDRVRREECAREGGRHP